MGANGLQPILNAIMSIFSFIGCPLSSAIPTDMLRFLFVSHAFLLMFCATHPTGSDRHKTRAAVCPHDGSLATVCVDSRELLHCVENH